MEAWQEAMGAAVGREHLLLGAQISEDYGHDESLTLPPIMPAAVVRPASTEQVAAVLRLANEHGIPVTARGSGTGLSGACRASEGGIVLSLERMKHIKEIDTENHIAVVEPGVTLAELAEEAEPKGLVYPILPGESSASLGGNVATNAGGMRAVKYGVTRNNVLGLEVALPTGEVIRTGGKFVKCSTGLDLTQLLIGSEGMLGVVTEITLKLQPFLKHKATMLIPFETMEAVTQAVPKLLVTGVGPLMLEYIDMMTMAAILEHTKLDLGVPQAIRDKALAYLVVVLEARTAERLQEDVEFVGIEADKLGAMDVFALPPQAGSDLLHAREQAFWVAKKLGVSEILDVVVPRAAIPEYMQRVQQIAQDNQTLVGGCGHAGDGNVHLSVFQGDAQVRKRVIKGIFEAGIALGGMISAEHGIGVEKRPYFMELEDPVKVALMQRIKRAFDPKGILNPGSVYG